MTATSITTAIMLSNIGRAAVRRVSAGASCQSTARVLQSLWHLQCAGKSNNADSPSNLRQCSFSVRRSYATAAKPKATSSTTEAKPKTKKTAPKKPAKKAMKKKVAVKPKPKAKPKKKVITEEQKQRAELKALKVTALTPPKGKPATAWAVLLTDMMKNHTSGDKRVASASAEAAARYKSLTTEELEQYNHTANHNKMENEVAYKKWIDSHTPEEIRLANNARNLLKKKAKINGSAKFALLEDPRIPKRTATPYALFSAERWKSGDFKGIKIPDAAQLISKEWKELSPSQRKSYEDQSAADSHRYVQEYKTVFGRDPKFITEQQKAAA